MKSDLPASANDHKPLIQRSPTLRGLPMMRITFAVAVLAGFGPSFAAGQGLALTNVRNTYGELGGTRPDSKFMPGDVVFVAFDIENITVGADGTCKYTMGMAVNDKNNKPTLKQDPAEREDYLP